MLLSQPTPTRRNRERPRNTLASRWEQLWNGVAVRLDGWVPEAKALLTPDAIELLSHLHRCLDVERTALLKARAGRHQAYASGVAPGYLRSECSRVRSSWYVSPLPQDLREHRVSVTGPAHNRASVAHLMNNIGGPADTVIFDMVTAREASWTGLIAALQNLAAAAQGNFTEAGASEPHTATQASVTPLPIARVRPMHMEEEHVQIDRAPVSAGLFDVTLAALHTAAVLMAHGRTPMFAIVGCEHYLEARWWNRLLGLLEMELGFQPSTLRAVFTIETIAASYQMREILYETRRHAAGLSIGCWDQLQRQAQAMHTGDQHAPAAFQDNLARMLIRICHTHGAHASGAFPDGFDIVKGEDKKVCEQKLCEAALGMDACTVSTPELAANVAPAFQHEDRLTVLPDLEEHVNLLA